MIKSAIFISLFLLDSHKFPISFSATIQQLNLTSMRVEAETHRPLTRALLTKLKALQAAKEDIHKNQHVSVKDKVQKFMQEGLYDQVLQILKSINPPNHWLYCKRAQVQVAQNHTKEALKSIRSSLVFRRDDCQECTALVIKIMEEMGEKSPQIDQIVSSMCEAESSLPLEVKDALRHKRHQLTKKYHLESEENDRKFLNLLEYYRNEGAELRKMCFKQVQKNFRITVAKQKIQPHENILQIPEKQIITLEMARRNPEIRLLSQFQKRLRSPKHTILSLFLLQEVEQAENSKYQNYIKCLPSEIANFPICYDEELLGELAGSSFLVNLRSKKDDIEQDFKTVKKILPERKNINFDNFLWARMMICSRIFGITINGIKTDALVPIADMLNHKIPKMTTWYFSDDKKCFVVQNLDDEIQEGEEIFDSYGNKCNSRFLINYGFLQPFNCSNEVVVQFLAYKNYATSPPSYRINTQLMNDQIRSILSYYRKAVDCKNKVETTKTENNRINLGFISKENETEVWKMIRESMKRKMKYYPTTIRQDEDLLADESLSFNLRNCIEIRLGEKKVLEFYITMAHSMIDHFTGKKNIDQQNLLYDPYLFQLDDSYCFT